MPIAPVIRMLYHSTKHKDLYSVSSLLTLVGALLLQGCASVYKPHNDPIKRIDTDKGYHVTAKQRRDTGENLITLSFSGGGTRAAAFSYGILQELRDTQVDTGASRIRLLDDVDTISSVSGGSFTAAYYGLFGDKLFTDYEDAFLRQSVQGALIRKILNPVYWWQSLFTGYDRTEMAVEYYDQTIFKGKTFSDIQLDKRPFIEINATDLSTGMRFSFTQGMFNLICSDLNSFSVARAVTASSAVPIAFPPIVLRNTAGHCGLEKTPQWQILMGKTDPGPRELELRNRFNTLQDTKQNAYLHLVDGGIADNLGLRALIERVDSIGGINNTVDLIDNTVPKHVLIILVNAAVKPERSMNAIADLPSVADTVSAFTDAQMRLYSLETRNLARQQIRKYEQQLQASGHDTHFYFAEVDFESIKSITRKSFFNNLPTTLELEDEQIDSLIDAGRNLLRENPEFKAFLQATNGKLVKTKPTLKKKIIDF